MIKLINQLLQIGNLYGISEEIDIAKGKYKIPETIKESWKSGMRDLKSLKYNK